MTEQVVSTSSARQRGLAVHGWVGLALVAIFWPVNWLAPGTRTAWAFFPLWLGFCLTIDALVLRARGTSFLQRDWRRYVGLFLVSAPVWWIFEVINWRIQNWAYLGNGSFTPLQFFLLATLNFSVVIPAIFGAAELVAGTAWVKRLKPWLKIRPDRRTTLGFFIAGWIMLALMIAWPRYFFPFIWLSVTFILEPINVWRGHHSLTEWLQDGDWRPVVSLFLGALLTGFFWELWNFYSFPKWVYHVPGVDALHVFEMPLLGYTGYLPFALELYAMYHLVIGLRGHKQGGLVNIGQEKKEHIREFRE